MKKIADPLICATGKIYSLAGLRLLLQELHRSGGGKGVSVRGGKADG